MSKYEALLKVLSEVDSRFVIDGRDALKPFDAGSHCSENVGVWKWK